MTDLRPRTVIKDDAMPFLLQQQRQPTFITINERDFWRRIPANEGYCIVCWTLTDTQAREISVLLRRLFRHADLRTRRERMGKVIRVAAREVSFYAVGSSDVKILSR